MPTPPATPKLYYSPGACSLAAHILLEEIGAPFDVELVSIRDGANTRPEYRAIHPLQRVPALAIGGEILTEVGAILHFLADAHPQRNLAPAHGSLQRARSLEWCSFLASSVHIAFAQQWRPERFSDDATAHGAVKSSGKSAVERFFAAIDEKMSLHPYALGGEYSVCDPYLLVFYRWGNRIELPMESYPHWTRHAKLLLARDAVQRAFKREDISIR
jgi:glutathione S-transferase